MRTLGEDGIGMKMKTLQRRDIAMRAEERGQTMLFVLLGLSIFLLAAAAFAVDLSNIWFHRQVAQDAADAACTAGAMDMLEMAQGGSVPTAHFVPGSGFNCSTTSPNTDPATAPVPCWYASKNGYSAIGLSGGTPSNEVRVTFPGSVPGVNPPPAADTPGLGTGAGGRAPFLQVNVVDRVQSFFMGLVSGSKTMDVGALATCGVVAVPSQIPILVLNPLGNSVDLSGSGEIEITGGGTQGIQVNSSNTGAISGGTVDLQHGGPNFTGSSLGVTGAETMCCNFLPGPTYWDASHAPIPDPLASLPTPPLPGNTPPAGGTHVPFGVNGCPDSMRGCQEYVAGYYPNDITIGVHVTAIFDPGLYYLDGALSAGANSCVRPSTAPGDSTGGTIFYFHRSGTLNIDANSGGYCSGTVTATALKCTPGSVLPGNGTVPDMTGNVFVAPCTGPYGDQLLIRGIAEVGGEQRGILFFQNRAVAAVSTTCSPPNNGPCWGGNGSEAAVGTMYFHQCVASGTDTGFNCSAAAYHDTFQMSGNPGTSSYVVGAVITDKIKFNGNPKLNMALNTNPSNDVLKASLLK
jgi:hypothetical protein